MQIQPHSIWPLRMATFALAALATASASYWALKWRTDAPVHALETVVFANPAPADPQAVARLLGGGPVTEAAAPQTPAAPSRYKLTGVVAERTQQGYALIAVDGQPAKSYRVGTLVGDGLLLQSVTPDSAALAPALDAPAALRLSLPKPPP